MKWEKLFKPHILERGYEYFRSHSIQNMEISSNRIRANVLGTEEYEVEILLSQDNTFLDYTMQTAYSPVDHIFVRFSVTVQ